MADNPVTKYTDEYRRGTADCTVSTGRSVAVVARELGLNPKTANRWDKDCRDRPCGAKPTKSEEVEQTSRCSLPWARSLRSTKSKMIV